MEGTVPRRFTICVLTAIVATCSASRAIRAQTVQDEGVWTALFAQGDLAINSDDDGPFRWWFDGHARFLEDADGFAQSIVRPGLGYAISDQATLWAGYGWIRTSPITGADIDESRIWQQITWSKSVDPLRFAFRSRLEQRFLEIGDETGWRFRQLVRVQHSMPAVPHLSLVAWDELFIHLNDTDWGAANGFDQNRVFVGLGWKCDPESSWRTEIGYLHQFIDRSTGADRSHHILSVNVYRSR